MHATGCAPNRSRASKTRTGDEFWFDYIADSGDGQKAVYNIGYLCQGDLWLPQAGSQPGAGIVSLKPVDNGYRLPRGQFLLVGGDTAYHIADYETLADRFRKPLNWAYDDRCSAGETPSRTYIYGIPGNHDYYDALDGFNRQFLEPITPPTAAGSSSTISPYGQLKLEGFDREQKASYVALDLPHDWKLWALDAQDGNLDKRQQAFFLETCAAGVAPKKLIVATPEPVTEFGKYKEPDAEIVQAYTGLGLEPAFLKQHDGGLAGDRCRLDISGDVHHYARYWGTGAHSPPSGNDRPNYAALVAGGGGAFLHASHTDVEQVPHAVIYPPRGDSHNLMLKRLLNPRNIFSGGYVFVAGAIVAAATYFAAAIPDSSWSASHWLTRIGNGQRPCGDQARCAADPDSLLERSQWALGIPGETRIPIPGETAQYTFPLLLDVLLGTALLVVLIYLAFRTRTDAEKLAQAGPEEWHSTRVRWMAFVLLWLAAPFVLFLIPLTVPPAFFASFMVFLFMGVLIAGLVFCRYVSDVLIARKKHLERQRDEGSAPPLQERSLWHRLADCLEPYLPFALIAASWISVSYGVWRFGAYNASIVLTDVVTLLVLGLATLGLVALGFFVGGKLYEAKDRKQFLLLGAWHAFVQVAVPFVLIAYCGAWEIVGILAAIGAMTAAAWHYFRVEGEFTYTDQKDCARRMWIAWIAVGLLPFLAALVMNWGDPAEVVTLCRIVGAALIGALLSCVWFGWYLAVSLAFNAHNNEAGGGARTEQFRHLVRIKLTRDSLTGYVIGIDEPVASFDGNPKFRLVDVFTISCPSQRTP